MLEQYLIEHCSPTLAGIKTANLFNMSFPSEDNFHEQISEYRNLFCKKGVTVTVLKKNSRSALVYVYRRQKLAEDLQKESVGQFLRGYGYESTDTDYAVAQLKKRLENSEGFPHEIGLFLGYPLGDVAGFIENAGKNSKCAGCWKVYCNECETMKLFEKFRKCREIYTRLWRQGKRTVWQLTVAA